VPSTKPSHDSKLDEDTAEELETTEELLEATEELLISMLELLETPTLDDELLDEETAEELETTKELLEATDELLTSMLELLETPTLDDELLDKEPPNELELHPTGGGGISRSDEQEKSSEVQSTAARVIEQGKSFFIVCSPFCLFSLIPQLKCTASCNWYIISIFFQIIFNRFYLGIVAFWSKHYMANNGSIKVFIATFFNVVAVNFYFRD